MAQDESSLPLQAFDTAQEIAVDGYHGLMVRNGVAKLTFYSLRFEPISGKMIKRAVLVLNTGLPNLVLVRDALNQVIQKLEDDGIFPAEKPHRAKKAKAEV